jgi:hypothetical protein
VAVPWFYPDFIPVLSVTCGRSLVLSRYYSCFISNLWQVSGFILKKYREKPMGLPKVTDKTGVIPG